MSLRIDQLLSLTIFILFFGPYQAYACSCDFKPFCDYMSEQDSYNVVIKAKVLRIEPIDEEFHAAYFKVIKKYRDDIAISSTIRLVGKNNEGPCYVDFKWRMKIDSSYIMAFQFDNPEGVGYFDSPIPPSNTYWSHVPDLCSFEYLRIEGNSVKGWMRIDVVEYPLDSFDEALMECNFSINVLKEFLCQEAEYYISPNPSSGRDIQIRSSSTYSTNILKVEIFNEQGVKMHLLDYPSQNFRFDLPARGVYFARISCPGRIETKKIIVEN